MGCCAELEAGEWRSSASKSTNSLSSITTSHLPPVTLEGICLWGCSGSHYLPPSQEPDGMNSLLCVLNTKSSSLSLFWSLPVPIKTCLSFKFPPSPIPLQPQLHLPPLQPNFVQELIVSTSSPPTFPSNYFNLDFSDTVSFPDFCIGSLSDFPISTRFTWVNFLQSKHTF